MKVLWIHITIQSIPLRKLANVGEEAKILFKVFYLSNGSPIGNYEVFITTPFNKVLKTNNNGIVIINYTSNKPGKVVFKAYIIVESVKIETE